MSVNPYKAPDTEITAASQFYSPAELENISLFFNMVIGFFITSFFSGVLHSMMLSLMLTLAYVASIYYLVKNARIERAWLYVLLAFIPLANLISLVILIRSASAILKENGYKIGLLGARRAV